MNSQTLFALLLSMTFMTGYAEDNTQATDMAESELIQTETVPTWYHDLEAGLAAAKKENKYVMVDFTGSDWCGWCIKLKKEVFSHDSFVQGASKNFVLVECDKPKDKSIVGEEQFAKNMAYIQKYGIRGFPTVLILDTEGTVIARTGYQEGGPEKYVAHLNTLLKTGAEQVKAKKDILAKAKAGDAQAKTEVEIMNLVEKAKKITTEEEGMPILKQAYTMYTDGKRAHYSGTQRDYYQICLFYTVKTVKDYETSKKVFEDFKNTFSDEEKADENVQNVFKQIAVEIKNLEPQPEPAVDPALPEGSN